MWKWKNHTVKFEFTDKPVSWNKHNIGAYFWEKKNFQSAVNTRGSRGANPAMASIRFVNGTWPPAVKV